jgi:hypothetical protein
LNLSQASYWTINYRTKEIKYRSIVYGNKKKKSNAQFWSISQ